MKKCEVIADVSSNHMGNIELAKAMIKGAKNAGIDTVKFQSWQADKLSKNVPDYRKTYERHKLTELTDDDHKTLIEECKKNGINFLTTCFDLTRADFLASLGLKRIKIASSDCNSVSLLKKLMKLFPEIIISTGMSTEEEILEMLDIVKNHNVVILHCVSMYPTELKDINLSRMLWLEKKNVRVGFSDHCLGTEAAKIAIACGAEIVEKHLTISRFLPGKDQAVSSNLSEFYEICQWAKLVKKVMGKSTPLLTSEQNRLRKIYIGKWGNNR